jgi:hypothetical protein
MPHEIDGDRVRLSGPCSIEDAETLHEALRGLDRPIFEIAEGAHLHTAIAQLILTSGGRLRALPDDLVLAACLRDRVMAEGES